MTGSGSYARLGALADRCASGLNDLPIAWNRLWLNAVLPSAARADRWLRVEDPRPDGTLGGLHSGNPFDLRAASGSGSICKGVQWYEHANDDCCTLSEVACLMTGELPQASGLSPWSLMEPLQRSLEDPALTSVDRTVSHACEQVRNLPADGRALGVVYGLEGPANAPELATLLDAVAKTNGMNWVLADIYGQPVGQCELAFRVHDGCTYTTEILYLFGPRVVWPHRATPQAPAALGSSLRDPTQLVQLRFGAYIRC